MIDIVKDQLGWVLLVHECLAEEANKYSIINSFLLPNFMDKIIETLFFMCFGIILLLLIMHRFFLVSLFFWNQEIFNKGLHARLWISLESVLETTWVYLFLSFLGLRGCMEGYKYALNQFCNILLHSLLFMAEHGFNIRGFILFC